MSNKYKLPKLGDDHASNAVRAYTDGATFALHVFHNGLGPCDSIYSTRYWQWSAVDEHYACKFHQGYCDQMDHERARADAIAAAS